ncbi:ABC transporter ATP-binding protein [Microbacterium esteraromaticum]|uniref:ABC transporter ATP-binding protein n=1 Tax=Microbacterium esteraromaticum TaxID=57043 RepID=A0A7D8AHJ0_9MICO|nr:ABC transporter ATP-binding protein [Microbacterium esteraromaticum]QMU95906.1 ABC transporter ATP-binding protein [Microbacterium esteraromaticum]
MSTPPVDVHEAPRRSTAGTGLTVRGARARRDGADVLDDADLHAPSGRITALIGPNGAGKSTLLHAMAGTIPATFVELTHEAADLLGMPRRSRARTVAFVEQEPATPDSIRVHDLVTLGRLPHDGMWAGADHMHAAVRRGLHLAEAKELAGRAYESLSGGEKQRAQLARALAQEPRLLLLDEPTNHLDIRAQLSTLALLRRLASEGVTVVAALHDLSLAAAHADHVVVMAGGRVVCEGTPQDVLTPSLLHEVWGVHADVLVNPTTGQVVLATSLAGAAAPR